MALFVSGIAPHLLERPLNVLRASLHPDGLATHIVNLAEWRAHVLARLGRQIAASGDAAPHALYEELRGYSPGTSERHIDIPARGAIVIPLRIRHGPRELSFFSTVTTFGTPLDVTLEELAIESFFPADEMTRRFCAAPNREAPVAAR